MLQDPGYPQPVATLAEFRLPRRLRATLARLTPIVCTEEAQRLEVVGPVVEQVELFLRTIPAHMRVGLVAGLVAFEQSARLAPGSRGRSFSQLDDELARAHFQRWWGSKLGVFHQLARALKMFISFAYYEQPRVKEAMGYRPEDWIRSAAARRQERYGEEIAAAERELFDPSPLLDAEPHAVRRALEEHR
jgi:hypothetical protein